METKDYISSKERLALFKPKKYSLTRFINRFKNRNARIKNKNDKSRMLILKRNPGQSIWIGNDIQIILLSNLKGQTRIGIRAPSEIRILREELITKRELRK